MSLETRKRTTDAGDPEVTITITGPHDIMRFADRMLGWQCEFGAAGRRILRSLSRHMGAANYKGYAEHLGIRDALAVTDPDPRLVLRAIADPGSIVGRRLHPSWGEGNDGYRETAETVSQWSTRAVMAVLDGSWPEPSAA